jgi:hypothetical protein
MDGLMSRFLSKPTAFLDEFDLPVLSPGLANPLAFADRSLANQAKSAAGQAGTTAANLGASAATDRSAILPGLSAEAANPIGYTPTQMNNQLVAGEQGAGGANAGITGEAGLHAARTRNSSGYPGVLDEAARDKTRQLSQNALNVQNKSAELGQKKQMFAQGELSNLYGVDTHSMLSAMGLVPQDINAATNANKVGWVQNFTDILNSLKSGGGGSGGGGASAGANG